MRNRTGDKVMRQRSDGQGESDLRVSPWYFLSKGAFKNQEFSFRFISFVKRSLYQMELLSRRLNMELRTYGRSLISKCKFESTQSINVTENHESV